jgi:hypothetical protein
LQLVRRLACGDDRRELLDSAVMDLLADPAAANGEIGIAYPARYYDGPSVQRYRGTFGSVTIDTDELTLEYLQHGVRRPEPGEDLGCCAPAPIEGSDDAGQRVGGDVSALHWMGAEIIDPHRPVRPARR